MDHVVLKRSVSRWNAMRAVLVRRPETTLIDTKPVPTVCLIAHVRAQRSPEPRPPACLLAHPLFSGRFLLQAVQPIAGPDRSTARTCRHWRSGLVI